MYELTRLQAYISAVTDPRTISIVGPARVLEQVESFANAHGLLSQQVHIRGKVHNPKNQYLAADLEKLCLAQDNLRLPNASELKVPFRSNLHGETVSNQSLTNEVIQTILTSRCEWYRLLGCVASDLSQTRRTSHNLINFGTGDCLSLIPFHQHGLTVVKLEAMSFIKNTNRADPQSHQVPSYEYPAHAVAVVGMACRLPGADNVEELWNLMSHGKSTVQSLPGWRLNAPHSVRFRQDNKWASRQQFYGNFIDRPDTFDHAFFGLNPREAVYMDPQQRLLLETAYHAVEASGYLRRHRKEDGDDIGVFIGNTSVDYLANTSSHPPSAYTSTGTLGSFLCGRICHHFGWTGPSEVIDTACSSSLVAINRACKAIQNGECSMALAGGVNIISSNDNYLDLGKAGFLSTTGQCKPFANDADGYCRAEGVGLVFLKSLDQAVRDNDQILGVVCGVASNQGGLSSSITVPHSPTQISLYRKILDQAGMNPYDVSYVEAHGTGTQVGDPLEMASIREVFGGKDRETTLHVGSIKGNIGHCETAAGVAGFIKAILVLQKGTVPPLASHTSLNEKIPDLETDRMAIDLCCQDWNVPFRAVCVNSYGAAGSNAAVLLCQPPSKSSGNVQQIPAKDAPTYPFYLSARSEEILLSYAKDLCTWIKARGSQVTAADVAFTLAEKRAREKFCWSSAFHSLDGLCQVLDHPLEVSPPSRSRSLVLVFCGQMGQSVGLSPRLYESCGLFRSFVDRCDRIVRNMGLPSLIPAIFRVEPIEDIRLLHCCLFTQQYACAQTWMSSGLRVAALVGQSFGELTALAVGGYLSLEDALTLITTRASIIQSQWDDEKGAMLSIRCTAAMADQLVIDMKRSGKDIELACYNAEDSFVLGGRADAVAATEKYLQQERKYSGVIAHTLGVTHAYHTRLTEEILDDLESAASILAINAPTIPLTTCTRDVDQTITPRYIRSHMRDPVYFQAAIRRLEERLGGCVWLEAGCDSPAFAIVKRAVVSPERHLFQAVQINGSRRPMDMMATITSDLWRAGVDVSYWNFHNPYENGLQQVWLPPYHFEKTRHWLPRIDHAVQALQGQEQVSTEAKQSTHIDEAPLVTRVSLQPQGDVERFEINTSTRRCMEIVTGHCVLGRLLCPAGLYMECAFIAARGLLDDPQPFCVTIEGCTFDSPLVNLDRAVTLDLRKRPSGLAWSFEVSSACDPSSQDAKKSSFHATGIVGFQKDLQLEHYQRIISRRVRELRTSTDIELLLKDKAYMVFNRIVNYSDIFRGISSIKFADTEALAEVHVPSQGPSSKATATTSCDTISLDIFVQVCGLLVNSHRICPTDSAYLAVGADSIRIARTCDLKECRDWTVYAAFQLVGHKEAKGDVFVMSPSGELVIVMIGIVFAMLPLKTLEKLLDIANKGGQPKPHLEEAEKLRSEKVPSLTQPDSLDTRSSSRFGPQEKDLHPQSKGSAEKREDERLDIKVLREIVASYAGLSTDHITDQTSLGALGIDSLASIELADDLSLKAGIQISATTLLDADFATLCRHFSTALAAEGDSVAVTEKSTSTAPKRLPQALQCSSPKAQIKEDERQKLAETLSQYSGCPSSTITNDTRLEELGIDSLAKIEMTVEIKAAFNIDIQDDLFDPETKVTDILQVLSPDVDGSEESSLEEATSSRISLSSPVFTPNPPKVAQRSYLNVDPVQALAECDKWFPSSAKENGFTGYWDVLAPKYEKVVLAYIVEAFAYLGSDLRRIQPDGPVPTVDFLPRHSRVMQCLWDILERQEITYRKEGITFRTSKRIIDVRSSQLTRGYMGWHPKYAVDFALMALTGPALADCLTGTADPLKILFSNSKAQQVLDDFYHHSPMLATMTDQLIIFMKQVISQDSLGIVRILEIGAGFGGTTTALAKMLHENGLKVEYTFTDVAPTLVDKARQRFSGYSWMDFRTLNLDQDPPTIMQGQYDIVIATNVVHATKDLVASTERMKSLLKDGGFICLSEITKVIDWHNVVFGLLPGWWSFTDGRTYALQSAEEWMTVFKKARFESTGYSTGLSTEAKTQQLLVGSLEAREKQGMPRGRSKAEFSMRTVVYKTIDDTDIHADVYFPVEPTSSGPMPIGRELCISGTI